MTFRMNEARARNSAAGSSPPFGALAPGPFAEAVRGFARRMPDNAFFRKTSSVFLGPAGARSGQAFDVTVFDTMKARLHPHDNICEKRVYLTPQHWDPVERARLAKSIASGAGPFTFVDVGANAGLYSLFAASAARAAARPIRIIAIEPDPVIGERMARNFEFSGVEAEILPCAATAAPGMLAFTVNQRSRGESRIAAGGAETVRGEPLFSMLAARGLSSIDAMKVDIEGHEFPALDVFFRDAPRALWPRLLILEVSHDAPPRSARELVLANGYKAIHANRLNAVFER
jgi:FkbM family methyltransferase